LSLWIACSGLLLVSLAAIILQVLRSKEQGKSGHNAVIYHDQLREIKTDVERGLLGKIEAEALKSEIKQRLDKAQGEVISANTYGLKVSSYKLNIAVLIVMIIPLASFSLYSHLGSPKNPDLPFSKRQILSPVDTVDDQMNLLLTKLKKRLETQPDKIDGWLLLGQSLANLKRYAEASVAFKRAFKIDPKRAEIAASAAETGFMAVDGKFTAEIREFFQIALELNSQEHKALYYLGLDFFLQKKYTEAIQSWVDLVAFSSVGAPWLDNVRQRLIEASTAGNLKISDFKPSNIAPLATRESKQVGPTVKDIEDANEMSNQDRNAFIRSMVERLSERLKNEPNNLSGWRRLARSYKVLGEFEKAAQAEKRVKLLEK
jgi:cytochrome c-type biogenesis protein CcmH